MKKTSYVLLITLVAATLSAVAQNQVDQQGRRQGHWVRIDNNGAKIFEGDFIDGLETGVFNYYYPDGTLRIRNTYTVDGVSATMRPTTSRDACWPRVTTTSATVMGAGCSMPPTEPSSRRPHTIWESKRVRILSTPTVATPPR